jgi:hypothetical protein
LDLDLFFPGGGFKRLWTECSHRTVDDDYQKVCGIITFADIARKKESLIIDVVREVSKPKPASLH